MRHPWKSFIPNQLVDDYCNVLACGMAAGVGSHESQTEIAVDKMKEIIVGILRKHCSDSPTRNDLRNVSIEVLEAALKYAKGELKL